MDHSSWVNGRKAIIGAQGRKRGKVRELQGENG